jgi:hypothetical protein
MSAWGSLQDAVETALAAGGYTVSALTDAAFLPSHTAGTEVVPLISSATDGIRQASFASDTFTVSLGAIVVGYNQRSIQRAGLELARALRTSMESSATLRASGTLAYRDASVTMRAGSLVADVTVVFDAYVLNSY